MVAFRSAKERGFRGAKGDSYCLSDPKANSRLLVIIHICEFLSRARRGFFPGSAPRGAERSPQVLAPQRLAGAGSDAKFFAEARRISLPAGGCGPGGR